MSNSDTDVRVKRKEVGEMWNRKRFLQLLVVGAALAGVLMIQAGTASAGVLTNPSRSR
jgi:hypothetical protein